MARDVDLDPGSLEGTLNLREVTGVGGACASSC